MYRSHGREWKSISNHKEILIRVIDMEIETTVQEISGSFYVRIPAAMASYLKLQKTTEAKIKELTEKKVEITFPVW